MVGNLIVPDDATCTLNGTEVQGAIVVKSRSISNATDVNVTGGLQGESPTTVNVSGSSFGNSISISKAEIVAPATTGGIGITGTSVTGDVQLAENRVPITLNDNPNIVGSVQASRNTDGLEIFRNTIGNGLQCQDNTPPP